MKLTYVYETADPSHPEHDEYAADRARGMISNYGELGSNQDMLTGLSLIPGAGVGYLAGHEGIYHTALGLFHRTHAAVFNSMVEVREDTSVVTAVLGFAAAGLATHLAVRRSALKQLSLEEYEHQRGY